MALMSYSRRFALRGAVSEREFLVAMNRLGFEVVPTRSGATWEFIHPHTGERRYVQWPPETYSHALTRFREELRAGREWQEVVA